MDTSQDLKNEKTEHLFDGCFIGETFVYQKLVQMHKKGNSWWTKGLGSIERERKSLIVQAVQFFNSCYGNGVLLYHHEAIKFIFC